MLLESVPTALLQLNGNDLKSNPSAFTHRSVNTDQAYRFDLAIWGPGNVSAYEKLDQGETPDLDTINPSPLYNTFDGIMPLPEEKVFTEPKTGTIQQIANRLQHPDGELSGDDKATLARLIQRDGRVRAHENAHQSAGGGVIMGGASYTYQRGPDGNLYAIGGSIMIDSSPVYGNPQATIQKMQQVRSAALAPADPSAADMRVASAAMNSEMAARSALTQMLVETRQQIREGLSPARRSIANEYARETQLANSPDGSTSASNKAAQEMLLQQTQKPQNLERERARTVAATYQQARLEAPVDVTETLIS